MTGQPAGDAGWATRVAKAGVHVKLWDNDLDDHRFALLGATIQRAVRESTLSDEDLYPLLVQFWIGRPPTVDWPPEAATIVRRCATELAAHGSCELDEWVYAPTNRSLLAARNTIFGELRLAPRELLAALADHWEELSHLEMPIHCTLLTFAQHVLLEPLVGACALLWSTLESSPAIPEPQAVVAWGDWSPVENDDWSDVVAAELAHLDRPPQRVPNHGDEAAMLLAAARAADLVAVGEPARIATSIVRTSGWRGNAALIAPLAARAVDLAQLRRHDINPETDNDDIVDAIQLRLMPPKRVLIDWIRDPMFGTLRDHTGTAATGAEMANQAADWLIWSLARAAVEVFAAMRRPPPSYFPRNNSAAEST